MGALGASKASKAAGRSSSSNNPIAALDDGNRTGSSSSGSRSSRRHRRRRRHSSSSSTRASSLPGSALSGTGVSFQDLRSSEKLSDGLLTTADGSSFCVASKDMFATKPAANPAAGGKLSFASTGLSSSSAAADLHDPACDDQAVDRSKYCNKPKPGGASQSSTTPKALSFMDTASAAVTPVGPDGLMPDGSLSPTNNASALTCTQGFTKVGSCCEGCLPGEGFLDRRGFRV